MNRVLEETRALLVGTCVAGFAACAGYIALGSPSQDEMMSWVIGQMYGQPPQAQRIMLPINASVTCLRTDYNCRVQEGIKNGAGFYYSGVLADTNDYRMSVPVSVNPADGAGWATYSVSYSEGVVQRGTAMAEGPPQVIIPNLEILPPQGALGELPVKGNRNNRPEQQSPQVPPVTNNGTAGAPDLAGQRCVFAFARWTNGAAPPQNSPRTVDMTVMENGAALPQGYVCVYGV